MTDHYPLVALAIIMLLVAAGAGWLVRRRAAPSDRPIRVRVVSDD